MESVIEILILHALTLQAQGDVTGAIAVLERALALAAPEGYVRAFADEGVPMATLLRDVGLGAPQPAAQYARRLLEAFPPDEAASAAPAAGQRHADTPASTIQHLAEPLTERELEVLRLLAAGRSNQMIAEELIVAVGTVKRHVNSILGKLQAQSRLEAVARARDLGLV
jgi:LuxR family maltose regulon positive regulatory protein